MEHLPGGITHAQRPCSREILPRLWVFILEDRVIIRYHYCDRLRLPPRRPHEDTRLEVGDRYCGATVKGTSDWRKYSEIFDISPGLQAKTKSSSARLAPT